MRPEDDFEEEWVAGAQAELASLVESEFKRFKDRLKPKPKPTPWSRVKTAFWGILERIRGFLSGTARKHP